MNDIELLAEKLSVLSQEIEKELQVDFSISNFEIQVSSNPGMFRFTTTCTDADMGFRHTYADKLDEAISDLRKSLTWRKEIAQRKKEMIKRLEEEIAREEAT